MSKVYAIIGQSSQTVISDGVSYSPAENEILMQGERHEGENIVALEDGTWGIPLAAAKEAKHQELKAIRDALEVKDITVNGNTFDYDDKARERINAAIIALDLQGEEATIAWTLADNTSTVVTSADLKQVIGAVALRSDALHIAYRDLMEKLEACNTLEEVSAIVWEANE